LRCTADIPGFFDVVVQFARSPVGAFPDENSPIASIRQPVQMADVAEATEGLSML